MSVNILNLPRYLIERVDETQHDYHVFAETVDPRMVCDCGSRSLSGWGRHEQVLRDLPMHGKRVAIYVKARRFRCNDCGKTGFERLPATSTKRQMTSRLEKWVGQQSFKRVFTSIADETGLDEKTVRNIFRDHITDLEAEFQFEAPKWLGIDEIHIIRPRCVVANIESKTVVNILPDRNKRTVMAYFHALTGREKVKYVAMDMWTPYREAAAAVLPQATVIVDKFHVLRMANIAMELVRKGLRGSLPTKERRGLMHDRFILLKREHELSSQERFLLENWTSLHPRLGEAYQLKEQFFAIYEAANKGEAQRRYAAWESKIPTSAKAAFQPISTAWRNWHPQILAYFDHPITNAYTESLNNLIRVMNRLGRGYSFEALRAKILFTEGLHKHLNKRPKWSRAHRQRETYMSAIMSHDAPAFGLDAFDRGDRVNLGVDIAALARRIETGRF